MGKEVKLSLGCIFPSSRFQSACVFRSEVGFWWTAYIWVLCLHPFSQLSLVGAASDQLLRCPRLCSAWICIFFSAGQVLLSTLSWCSACTPVSEGVFLMHLCRETYSTSPTLVFSWPLFFIHSYGFELLSSVWTVILKDPLYISYEARLQGINSLDYCLSTEVLIWASLKKTFSVHCFPGWNLPCRT